MAAGNVSLKIGSFVAPKSNSSSNTGWLAHSKKYLSAPIFPQLKKIKRWQFCLAFFVTFQSVFPAELLFNYFFADAIWKSMHDLFRDHGYKGPDSGIDAARIVGLFFWIFNLIGDFATVSPPDSAVAVVNIFKGAGGFFPAKLNFAQRIAYAILFPFIFLFMQLGFAALTTPDAIAAGKLNDKMNASWLDVPAAGYFVIMGLVYYNIFLARKLSGHVVSLISNTSWFLQKLLSCQESMIVNVLSAPLSSLDIFFRNFAVFYDVSMNNAYRIIVTMYSIFTLNKNGVVNFGDAASDLMKVAGISTAVGTYGTRYLNQLASVDRKKYPFTIDSAGQFFKDFCFNRKVPLAMLRGGPLAAFFALTGALSVFASVVVGALLTLANMYVRYVQARPAPQVEERLPLVNSNDITKYTVDERSDMDVIKSVGNKFDTLSKNHGLSPRTINIINIFARIARFIALREFINVLFVEALPLMFDLHFGLTAPAVDMLWVPIGVVVGENDFYAFYEELQENLSSMGVKWSLENSAWSRFTSLFKPQVAYSEAQLDEALEKNQSPEDEVEQPPIGHENSICNCWGYFSQSKAQDGSSFQSQDLVLNTAFGRSYNRSCE